MKSMTLSRRFAAAGAVSALAAGALVATAGSASADPVVTNAYGCSTASGLAFPVSLTTNAVGIEGFPSIQAGAQIPAGLLSVTNHATMPSAAAQALAANHVDHVEIPDFNAVFGSTTVGTTGVVGLVANAVDNGDGTVGLDLPKDDPNTVGLEAGLNKAFEVPAAGEYDILMPSAFTIDAFAADNTPITTISCALTDTAAGALHHITVTKADSTTTAKPAKSQFPKGKPAKVKVTVTGGKTPTGKVLLKKGTQKLDVASLNDLGKATLSTTKLPVGKNKLKVVYKGDGYNSGSSATVIVKVVK